MLPTTIGDDEVFEVSADEFDELAQAATASAITPIAAANRTARIRL